MSEYARLCLMWLYVHGCFRLTPPPTHTHLPNILVTHTHTNTHTRSQKAVEVFESYQMFQAPYSCSILFLFSFPVSFIWFSRFHFPFLVHLAYYSFVFFFTTSSNPSLNPAIFVSHPCTHHYCFYKAPPLLFSIFVPFLFLLSLYHWHPPLSPLLCFPIFNLFGCL